MALSGCRADRRPRPTAAPVAAPDASTLADAPAVRRRVLGMPVAELGARLGGAALAVDTTFTLGEGSGASVQRDRASAEVDAAGHQHLVASTPLSRVELFVVGPEVAVRLGTGSLRRRSARDGDPAALAATVTDALPDVLGQLAPLAWQAPVADEQAGRRAWRYRLTRGEPRAAAPRAVAAGGAATDAGGVAPDGTDVGNWADADAAAPARPPPAWRAGATVEAVDGYVSVDAATGAVLRAEVEGRLRLGPAGDSLPVAIRASHRLRQVGRVQPIALPLAVAEFRRPLRPRDPLAFFRDQIPAPLPAAAATPTP